MNAKARARVVKHIAAMDTAWIDGNGKTAQHHAKHAVQQLADAGWNPPARRRLEELLADDRTCEAAWEFLRDSADKFQALVAASPAATTSRRPRAPQPAPLAAVSAAPLVSTPVAGDHRSANYVGRWRAMMLDALRGTPDTSDTTVRVPIRFNALTGRPDAVTDLLRPTMGIAVLYCNQTSDSVSFATEPSKIFSRLLRETCGDHASDWSASIASATGMDAPSVLLWFSGERTASAFHVAAIAATIAPQTDTDPADLADRLMQARAHDVLRYDWNLETNLRRLIARTQRKPFMIARHADVTATEFRQWYFGQRIAPLTAVRLTWAFADLLHETPDAIWSTIYAHVTDAPELSIRVAPNVTLPLTARALSVLDHVQRISLR